MATIPRGVIQRAKALQDQITETIDGHPRSKEADAAISESVARVLSTGDGKVMFDWLRQITVNKVLGASATDAELRFQEGMRCVTALLEARRVADLSRHTETQKKAGK